MAGIRGKDTKPELAIRSALHRAGFRFRLHRKDLPGRPDLVCSRQQAVLFIHGCFWHGHDCNLFRWPSTRQDFWRKKIEGNRARDYKQHAALQGRRVADRNTLGMCHERPDSSSPFRGCGRLYCVAEFRQQGTGDQGPMRRGQLADYFEGVAAKQLSAVDAEPKSSNQHEVGITQQIRKDFHLGDHQQKFKVTYIWLGDDQNGITAEGEATYYDTRQNQDRPAEWRLYYSLEPCHGDHESWRYPVPCQKPR